MRRRGSPIAPIAPALACLALWIAVPGCYYGHVARGQLRILLAREPIDRVLAAPETPESLREQLALVASARAFAADLGLDAGNRYTSYVDWPGDRIATSVVATRPRELEAAGFTFPIVGRVPYKGFFDPAAAEDEAAGLRALGMDVCLIAVPAYSTLGWMDDPVTAPMLRGGDAALVETVIHELVHATVFVASQPEFNEGAARFIGQEGSVRFFASDPAKAERARTRVEENRLLAEMLLSFRDEVAELYARSAEPPGHERARLESALRRRIAALPLVTRDATRVAERVRLNDACLAARGTYSADSRLHQRILAEEGGDLVAFIERLRGAAEHEDPRSSFFGPLLGEASAAP